jgi:hypothetical protein
VTGIHRKHVDELCAPTCIGRWQAHVDNVAGPLEEWAKVVGGPHDPIVQCRGAHRAAGNEPEQNSPTVAKPLEPSA